MEPEPKLNSFGSLTLLERVRWGEDLLQYSSWHNKKNGLSAGVWVSYMLCDLG